MARRCDRSRCQHFPDCADFFGQRLDAVAVYTMAEEIDGIDAENALRLLDEAVIDEALEELEGLLRVLCISPGDQDVVEVDKHVAKALCDTVHEALEGLCRTFQSKWHTEEFL